MLFIHSLPVIRNVSSLTHTFFNQFIEKKLLRPTILVNFNVSVIRYTNLLFKLLLLKEYSLHIYDR